MMQIPMIEQFLERIPADASYLPDRFCMESTLDEAWINVFGQDKRLKKMADQVRKSGAFKAMGSAGKVMAKVSDGRVLALLCGNSALRALVESLVLSGNPNALTLTRSVPFLKTSVFEAHPYTATPIERRYLEFMQSVAPSFVPEIQEFFQALSCKEYYESLSLKSRDAADLCLNLLLSDANRDDILSLFEGYPWLAPSQSRLISEYEDQISREDPEEIEASEYTDELVSQARRFYDLASGYRETRTIQRYVQIRSSLHDLIEAHVDHGSSTFSRTLVEEHSQMLGLFTHAGNVFNRLKIADGISLWAPILKAIDSLPDMTQLDSSCDKQVSLLEDFLEKRKELTFPAKSKFRDLHGSVVELEECMTKHAKIAQDGGGLDEILSITEKLTAARSRSIERAKDIAPIGIELVGLLAALGEGLHALQSAPKVDHEELAGRLKNELVTLTDAYEGLEQSNKKLTQDLEDALASLVKEKDRRISQEEAASVARRETHDLKQAMANIGKTASQEQNKDQLVDPSLIVDAMSGSLKLTPEVVLTTFAKLYPGELVILDSALKSARDAYNFEMGPRLVTLIQSLVTYMLAIREGKPDSEARVVLGGSYAANESTTVVQNAKLRAQREFTYGGKQVLFLAHIGIGKGFGTQHQIRIYFKVIDDRLVIAHCGERMESATSN